MGVVVSGFILAGFYFLTYAMLSCPYDDLNKCGIVVKWNSVKVPLTSKP